MDYSQLQSIPLEELRMINEEADKIQKARQAQIDRN